MTLQNYEAIGHFFNKVANVVSGLDAGYKMARRFEFADARIDFIVSHDAKGVEITVEKGT